MTGSGDLGIERFQNLQRILKIGPAPTGAWLGDLEIASRRGFAPVDPDSGLGPADHFAGLMLRDHAGDVIIDNNHFVDQTAPLRGEHADGGRATAHPHAALENAVDDRRLARLNHDRAAVINRQFDGFAIAERQHRGAGHPTFLLAATGQVMHPTDRQHL